MTLAYFLFSLLKAFQCFFMIIELSCHQSFHIEQQSFESSLLPMLGRQQFDIFSDLLMYLFSLFVLSYLAEAVL
jgi:hypothetical protein